MSFLDLFAYVSPSFKKPTIHNIDATLFKVIAISVYQFGSCMPYQ